MGLGGAAAIRLSAGSLQEGQTDSSEGLAVRSHTTTTKPSPQEPLTHTTHHHV